MKIEGDYLIFDSGKEISANNGIIGIAGSSVFEGYDGIIFLEDLTKAERIELADYMIAEWQAFKNNIENLPDLSEE
jgi:hypothetical protein